MLVLAEADLPAADAAAARGVRRLAAVSRVAAAAGAGAAAAGAGAAAAAVLRYDQRR